MKTRNLGILLDQNADFNLVIEIDGESGPLDITGYTFTSAIRPSTDLNIPVVATFSFSILNQVSNKGQVAWSLSAAASAEIRTSISNALQNDRLTTPYVFDVYMKDTANTVSRIIQGIVYVSPMVIRGGV